MAPSGALPEWGQGALITEKQFRGVDPEVPRAGVDETTPRKTGNQCLPMREGMGPGLNVKAD